MVRSNVDYGWAIRKNSPQLKAELNAFIKTHGKGTQFGNMTLQKYLKNVKFVKNATSEAERKKFLELGTLFKKYGDQYNVDWVLMAAQGYQESAHGSKCEKSRWCNRSHAGDATDRKRAECGGHFARLEPNIHAGIKYMRFMMDTYYKNEPMDELNKMLMTFASYNCGPGKMRTLRKDAASKGYNPNIWFNNVERSAAEKVGQETVTYVSNIYKYYVAYKLALEEEAERKKAKEQIKKPGKG